MNRDIYDVHYILFAQQPNGNSYEIKYISEEEFKRCTFGAIFYVQKPTNCLYMYGHDYSFHLVFYRNGLPTVIENNKWNVGPTINGQFVNLSHISKYPKGLTFHLSLCIQRNNFANDKNIYHSEDFLQSGVFYHGMLERLKDVPKLVMDIVCNRSVIADSYLYRALFCFDTTIIDENTIIKYLYLLSENKDLLTAFGMYVDYEKAVKHWKKLLQSKI